MSDKKKLSEMTLDEQAAYYQRKAAAVIGYKHSNIFEYSIKIVFGKEKAYEIW